MRLNFFIIILICAHKKEKKSMQDHLAWLKIQRMRRDKLTRTKIRSKGTWERNNKTNCSQKFLWLKSRKKRRKDRDQGTWIKIIRVFNNLNDLIDPIDEKSAKKISKTEILKILEGFKAF